MSQYQYNYARDNDYQQPSHNTEYQNYSRPQAPQEYQGHEYQAQQYSSNSTSNNVQSEKDVRQRVITKHPSPENPAKRHLLPTYMQDGRLVTKGINPDGESGRSGFHPLHFFRVAWRSATPWNKWLNLLWPFVPLGIVLHVVLPENHLLVFATNYVGMIPAASLLGFAGQELARKLPRVAGILLETALGSVVEIVLFLTLIVRDDVYHDFVPVIKAAILGSILANLLLCLGGCFLIGGLRWVKEGEQKFHSVVSEVGTGLLLVAAFGLLIPTAFYTSLSDSLTANFTEEMLDASTRRISRGSAIVLMLAFFFYLLYSAVSHDSIFDEVLRNDEEMDRDGHRDRTKQKFTLFEALVAIAISLTCVSVIAVFLVLEIEPMVEKRYIPDNFLGLILIPLVEKVAEHITAVDEAYDNQINFALYHCLAPSIQTALFNAPLVVFVGWGMGKMDMDLNFDMFMMVILVLAIIVVGSFLRDGSSNWLEGALLLLVYVIIAVTTFFMPNPHDLIPTLEAGDTSGGHKFL